MDSLYLICAAAGGSVLVIQTLLLVLGMGGDEIDVDDVPDDASEGFFKVLSLKTLVAFLTFFGLAGLAGRQGGMESTPVLLLALGSGLVAIFVVGYLMAGLSKLQSRGNLDLRNAVGVEGRVYLRVPAERAGPGKVLLEVQGRRIECKALTAGPEIPTGAQVRVVDTPAADTVEVQIV